MKISIDGLIGSAKRINNQRNTEGSDKKKSVRTSDSVQISSKIDLRLDSIQQDLKAVQSSLTRNQILNNGVTRLSAEINNSTNISAILDSTTFNNKRVLAEFMEGKDITADYLNEKKLETESLIRDDIARLTRLQVETENILASNLAGSTKLDAIFENVEASFANNGVSLNKISNLNADVVMRLIR